MSENESINEELWCGWIAPAPIYQPSPEDCKLTKESSVDDKDASFEECCF